MADQKTDTIEQQRLELERRKHADETRLAEARLELESRRGGTLSSGAVAAVGAIIALLSAIITALVGGYWQLEIERTRADAEVGRLERAQQFQILLRATEGVDTQVAADNLLFFVDIGYLDDPTGKIRDYAARGEAPTIASSGIHTELPPIPDPLPPQNCGYEVSIESEEPIFFKADNIIYRVEGAIRNRPVSHDLMRAISLAVKTLGEDLKIVVTSGGQVPSGYAGRRTGGAAHDVDPCGYGQAVDFHILSGDQKIIPNFNKDSEHDGSGYYEAISRHTAEKWPNHGVLGPFMHIGAGTPKVYGLGGKDETAPIWLRRAYAEGRKNVARSDTTPAPVE